MMRHDPPPIPLDAAFDEICSRFTLLPHNYLYVVPGKVLLRLFFCMRVGDMMRHDPPPIPLDAAFDEICSRFTLLPHNYLYVVPGKGRFYGVISLLTPTSRNS